jgi:hypothetical protein
MISPLFWRLDMFLFLLFLLFPASARPTLVFKNKTTLEFEIYRDYRPYIAEEITFNRAGFTLGDLNGQYMVNAYKSTFGIKYSDTDFIKIDPHWYIAHQRDNDWKLVHGPGLRIDVAF